MIVVSSESYTNGTNAIFFKTRSLFTLMKAVHIVAMFFK